MTETRQGKADESLPEWHILATKADLAELRTRLEYMATREDLAELRVEFAGLRGSLRMAGWFAGLVVGLLAVVALIALFFLQRSLP